MDNEQPTILIVDDEEKLVFMVRDYLLKEGYKVVQALNGTQALGVLKENKEIDLIVLDWMMPGINGLDTFRKLREFSDVPVIFLTAKTEEYDRIIGLELGADDYLTKPFSLRELVARIRVVLRRLQRSQSRQHFQQGTESTQLVRDSLHIDLERHKVLANGSEIVVTPTEFKLLATLAASPGRVYSRLQLLEIALGEEYSGYERSIDTHISNLRKKLELDPVLPEFILTVFGVGYKFREKANG